MNKRFSYSFAVILFAFAFSPCFAQPGCPDPQALNYTPGTSSNDGSCQYPTTTYFPIFKAILPENLKEISGNTRAGNKWWAHNDGGSDHVFFSINPETGAILQEIKLKNADNNDWEDIAAGNASLYVGDFGNNFNDRQNLGVYRVPLSEIGNSSSETVQEDEYTFIPFAYADQTDFSTQPEDSTEFDCEATIFFNGKIHLFTKNRKAFQTSHYVVNQSTGLAEKLETFDTQGLITAASLSPDGELVALLGYDPRNLPRVFCWLLWDWQPDSDLLFSGNKRRIELGSVLSVGQAEGIGFGGNRVGYLSNERTIFNGITLVDEATWFFDFSQWVPESVGTSEPTKDAAFQIFPNPFAQTVHFQFFENEKPDFLEIKNRLGQVVLRLNDVPENLDLSDLPPGFYAFEAIWKNGKIATTKGLRN